MTDALWYFARGSGLVTLVLLTVVVALGIGARSGRTAFGLPRFAVNLLHRNAALLAVVFLGFHVVSLLFVDISGNIHRKLRLHPYWRRCMYGQRAEIATDARCCCGI